MNTNSDEMKKPHVVSMEDRHSLRMTGVEDVESFDESAVIMSTSAGELTVRGSELHISSIDLDEGRLSVEGTISEMSYVDKRPAGGFWQKLFG